MIKIIRKSGFMPDLQKSIHYVSWTPISSWSLTGYSQMAFVDAVIRRNMPGVEPVQFYRTIDSKNETGTLYPKANITVMPGGMHTDQEIYKHFHDVFKAQNTYIHAKHLIFDMRNYSYYDQEGDYNNWEYLYMIDYNCSLLKPYSDFDVYVILVEDMETVFDKSYSGRYIGYQYISEKEIHELEL